MVKAAPKNYTTSRRQASSLFTALEIFGAALLWREKVKSAAVALFQNEFIFPGLFSNIHTKGNYSVSMTVFSGGTGT